MRSSKKTMNLIFISTTIFLCITCRFLKITADDEVIDDNQHNVSDDKSSIDTDVPGFGRVGIDESSIIDPEDPNDGSEIPNIPDTETQTEPDEVVTIINRGFDSISSIDTGDRQQWDYYKEIFLISGFIIIVMSLLQILKGDKKVL